mgnify:CR=1 FL=1
MFLAINSRLTLTGDTSLVIDTDFQDIEIGEVHRGGLATAGRLKSEQDQDRGFHLCCPHPLRNPWDPHVYCGGR